MKLSGTALDSVFLVFPHQLFAGIQPLSTYTKVLLVEEYLFFKQFPFHVNKLIFHRASILHYKDYLASKNIPVDIIDCSKSESDIRILIEAIKKQGVQHIGCYDTCDYLLQRRLKNAVKKHGLSMEIYCSPAFLLTAEEASNELKGQVRYHQTSFYINQRKKHNILLDSKSKPIGGKWSFDEANRERYPAKKSPPKPIFQNQSNYLENAIISIKKEFPQNPGDEKFVHYYPLTHKDAENWLEDFIKYRLKEFGSYEDAIVKNEWLLHHSLLSPLINAGLLTPREVLDKVLEANEKKEIPLNSVEGFVRQIIGWREYIRAVYLVAGTKQRTTNAWQFSRKMPASFYTASTGIEPLDDCIKKVLNHAYNHHIERLMIISNFMMLCEIHPDEVYRWFMELYIDAYDWVMVPNVYGMAQFSDGGLMCTKPYISGSRYILNMSDYPKNQAWSGIWDALYWRFVHVHRHFFQGNPRLAIMPAMFDKFEESKKQLLLHTAKEFLDKLI